MLRSTSKHCFSQFPITRSLHAERPEVHRVVLIRHGESLANVGQAHGSHSGVVLTKLGEQQAEALAALWTETPTLIVCSPFTRTRQTAAPTLARFASIPVEEWPVQEFANLDHDRWCERTFDEAWEHAGRFWIQLDALYSDGPGAESFTAFYERMHAALQRLTQLPDGSLTYVFSHGFAIHMLRLQIERPTLTPQQLMPVFIAEWNRHPIANTECLELLWSGSTWRCSARLS
jgi:broad specificity phosphatase PhoE